MPAETLSIEVKVTDRCNQCCFHCMNDDAPGAGRDLDCDLFLQRLTEWGRNRHLSNVNISEVRITGGEPLLNLPAVTAISRACRELQIVSGINTNASLLDKATQALLKDAGLTTIKASFDALEEDVWQAMRGSAFSLVKINASIREAVDAGFRVICARVRQCQQNLCRYRWQCIELQFPV
jgi:GTP 3',8-cyclase